MTKLQNFFSDYLPMNYREFTNERYKMTVTQSVVAELLRICCESDDAKAMRMTFERILGKPEKVIVIKRTLVRTVFPDATSKRPIPIERPNLDEQVVVVDDNKVVINEVDSPGYLLRKELDEVGEMSRDDLFEIIDNRNNYSVARVFAANVYMVAVFGSNLSVIDLLFNYLDGAVADVIRLDGEDTVMLENYADIAPFEAKQDANGVYYVETEAVK